jgi:hypothetical protein
VSGQAKGARQRGQRVGLIVDDEDICLRVHAAALGSVMINVAPPPGGLSTAMVPA